MKNYRCKCINETFYSIQWHLPESLHHNDHIHTRSYPFLRQRNQLPFIVPVYWCENADESTALVWSCIIILDYILKKSCIP